MKTRKNGLKTTVAPNGVSLTSCKAIHIHTNPAPKQASDLPKFVAVS